LASTTTERPARRLRRPDADAAVEQYRPSSRLTWRVGILGFALLAVFAALFLRLWALQVLSGPKYVNQAQANSFRLLRQQAPRGLLLDRTGIALVTNVPTTAIELWPSDLPKVYNDRYAELARLSKVARVPLYEIARGIKERKNSNDLVTPVTIRENASGPMQKYLAERASQFPGVTMNRSWIRHYPYQGLAAQALGYVGAITQSELKRLGKSYDLNDQIGQSGAESTYDTYLRGVAGASKLHVDNFGRPLGTAQPATLPKPGNSVRLTLSLKLQEAAERALQYGIGLAQSNGEWAARGGAIVALDPRDGSILAMASSPSYKPSVYAGHVTTKELGAQGLTTKTASSQNYPALNRATDATYPPGSHSCAWTRSDARAASS